MKLCLACKTEFEQVSWTCPVCSFTPPIIDGFTAFSPELANSNDGTPEGAHHFLNKIQDRSFWFRGRNQLIQEMILRFFPKAHNVLEIGCGSGYVLSGIRSILPHAQLTGTEIYVHGLHYAAERTASPSQFLQVDARTLPFKKEFDFIGAFDVLEHIDEDVKVIKNMREALKPNGGLILTVPQHPSLWSKIDELACHKRRYTQRQLSSLLKREGFDIVVDTSFMFCLLPLMFLQRVILSRKSSFNPINQFGLPMVIDKLFGIFLSFERLAIRFGIRFPIGGSRLVVAKLNDGASL